MARALRRPRKVEHSLASRESLRIHHLPRREPSACRRNVNYPAVFDHGLEDAAIRLLTMFGRVLVQADRQQRVLELVFVAACKLLLFPG